MDEVPGLRVQRVILGVADAIVIKLRIDSGNHSLALLQRHLLSPFLHGSLPWLSCLRANHSIVAQRCQAVKIAKLRNVFLCSLYVAQRRVILYIIIEVVYMAERKAKWQNDYIKRHYDRVNLILPGGQKETVNAAADAAGVSLNEYIVQAIKAKMDSGKQT
jgi:hypothetical protein